MRKALIILLAVVYLAVSSGFVVNLHYCMGKQIGVEIGKGEVSNTCDKCGMETGNDCCKDEVKVLKADITANFVNTFTQAGKFVNILPDHQQFTEHLIIADQHRLYAAIHSPPASHEVPIFIRNCVFRI